MQGDHVRVALGEHDEPGLGGAGAGDVDGVEVLALLEDVVVGGVEVLRVVVGQQRPRPEAEHAAAPVGQREHQPPAEAVHRPPLRALRQTRLEQLAGGEPRLHRAAHDPLVGVRRVADAELPAHLLVEPARGEVVARVRRLRRLPQHPHVVGGGPLEQLPQPLLGHPPLGLARVLLGALKLDPETVGEQLQRLRERDVLGLHDELEDVAAHAAAEAVVELLDRVDPERRRPLLVERAAARETVHPRLAQLRAGGDELDEVDRVAHALLRVVGVPSHRTPAGSPGRSRRGSRSGRSCRRCSR
jgi:hypothetical protein